MHKIDAPDIVITMRCEVGHVMGTWLNKMTDKYPLYCVECDGNVEGKYPFSITAVQNVTFTTAELGTLLALARKDAINRGYGKAFTEDNRSTWPHRLKRLRAICGKIREMRGE